MVLSVIERKAKIIQSLWRINKYYTRLNLLFFQKSNTGDFEKIKDLIQQKDVLLVSHIFINNIVAYLKLVYPSKDIEINITRQNTRIFLSYILVLFHSNKVIGEINKTDNRKDLKKNTIELHKTINILHNQLHNKHNLYNFIITYQNFTKQFNIWKERDANDMIQNMTHSYWELELMKRSNFDESSESGESGESDDSKQQIILSNIENQQEKIIKNIKDIGGLKGLEQFNNYVPIVFTDHFLKNTRDMLKIAYWDTIRKELYIEKKVYKLNTVMKELRSDLINLFKRDGTAITDINEYFDVDFITNMIQSDIYTIEKTKNLTQFFFRFIMLSDSPENDENNKESFKNILHTITEINEQDITIDKKVGESLIVSLDFCLPKLKEIIKKRDEFINNLNNDSNHNP